MARGARKETATLHTHNGKVYTAVSNRNTWP